MGMCVVTACFEERAMLCEDDAWEVGERASDRWSDELARESGPTKRR